MQDQSLVKYLKNKYNYNLESKRYLTVYGELLDLNHYTIYLQSTNNQVIGSVVLLNFITIFLFITFTYNGLKI